MPATGRTVQLKSSISEPELTGAVAAAMPEKSGSAPCLAASRIAHALPVEVRSGVDCTSALSGASLSEALPQKQCISYLEFNRHFLQRELRLSDVRGCNHMTLTLPELMEALAQTRVTLKGSSVNHWRDSDWSRDIDLLLQVGQGEDCTAVIQRLNQYLKGKCDGRWTLNEKVVDTGRTRFHKVQLGFPREGCYRIDLVVAESMEVKFDVLQASSEIEIDLTRRSVILKKLDNPEVLGWLQSHRLLCFHPDMSGGLGRLSIYCQKGARYLLQPGMLERFIEDVEPNECAALVVRQCRSLGGEPENTQRKFWALVVAAAFKEPEAAGPMLESMRSWMRLQASDEIPLALQLPEGLANLQTGVRVGADILNDMRTWLCQSNHLGALTQDIFADVLGVEVVPLPVLMDALDDLPAALDHHSLTLVHGIRPALAHWQAQSENAERVPESMRLRLLEHCGFMEQLPLRQCLLWLKQQPDLMQPDVRKKFEHLFNGVMMSSTSMLDVNEEKGGIWRNSMIRVIEVLDQLYPPDKSPCNHAGIRVIANALQTCRLVMVMPELELMTQQAHTLNTAEAAVLLCTMGGLLQRLAVECFESDATLSDDLSLFAKYLGPMFENLTQLQCRWTMERGVAWFKTADPKADGINWGWDAQQQKLLCLRKAEAGRSLISNTSGVSTYSDSFDKNHLPDRACTLVIRDGVAAHLTKLPGSQLWACSLSWKVCEWRNPSIKKWLDVSGLRGEPKDFSLDVNNPLMLSVEGNFKAQILTANAGEFEAVLLDTLQDAVFELKVPGSTQFLGLEIGNCLPQRLLLQGACRDPNWHVVADLTGATGNSLAERLDSAYQGLADVDLINVSAPNPVSMATKVFHMPMEWPTGRLIGEGRFVDRIHGYTYEGMIDHMSLVAPGVLTLHKVPGRWALPSTLNGQDIPHPFVEFIALFLYQNVEQLDRVKFDAMEVGCGRNLPEDFKGFINFEMPGTRIRAYVDGDRVAGEICLQGNTENDWEIHMGQFLRVKPNECEHPGLIAAGLTRQIFTLPWGLHLMPHGKCGRVLVDKANPAHQPSIRSSAFFAGYRVDLDVPLQKAVSESDNRLKLPVFSGAAEPDKLWIPAAGPWTQIQVEMTANHSEDRILFMSEVGEYGMTQRVVGAGYNRDWCTSEIVGPKTAKLTLELEFGIQYRGMARAHEDKLYPVPFGQITLNGIRYVMLKGVHPPLDQFALTGQNLRAYLGAFTKMYESQVKNAPLSASEFVETVANGSFYLTGAPVRRSVADNILRQKELLRLNHLAKDFQTMQLDSEGRGHANRSRRKK